MKLIITHMQVDKRGVIYGETIWSKEIEAETIRQAAYIAFREILQRYEKVIFEKYYADAIEEEYGILKTALTDYHHWVLLYTPEGQWFEEYSSHGLWTKG